LGSEQFSTDNPLYPINLRDGQKVWGFYRYTNELVNGKIVWTWEPSELSKQITKPRLDQLVKDRKYAVVTQHLGKGSNGFPFTQEGIQSLRLLKSYDDEGKILVARTSRLLDYARSSKYVKYTVAEIEGKTYIDIISINDPLEGASVPSLDEIRGLTFHVENPESAFLLLNDNLIDQEDIQRNSADKSREKSIGVTWFKPDYTDYTKS